MSYAIKLGQDVSGDAFREVIVACQEELKRIEAIFSLYRDDSELSRWNANGDTKPQAVSYDLLQVATIAVEVAAKTDGAFDPTIRPLIDLWGFQRSDPNWSPPSDESIRATLNHVGYKLISINEADVSIRKSHPKVQLDLNALVEGFALERLAIVINGRGLEDFLVELGGEYLGIGTNGGRAWTVAIEAPWNPESLIAQIELNNEVLAVSGNYRSWKSHGEQRYGHILNAKTGYPVGTSSRSIAVVSDRGCWADAWATGLMTMSTPEASAFMESESISGCIMVEGEERELIFSNAAQDRFVLVARGQYYRYWTPGLIFMAVLTSLVGLSIVHRIIRRPKSNP